MQYHTVKGSHNSADLFTKALEHDSIVRHTEAMGCEFMFGRDPIAFTGNNLSAKVSMEKVATEMCRTSSRSNGRVEKNGLALQNLQDHKQGERTELERRCIQSDS